MKQRYKDFLKLNFYQIYPKSFMDSNNDGFGDFKGIQSKVKYLNELGINAVWLSPFFKSPGIDSGYDISDYLDVGQEFGTLQDFKDMLDEFHKYNIKVIIDLVVNHTSTEHKRFKEARKSKDNPYRDFYYWFDEIPNDWNSCFGGSAYQFDETTKQYYLHSFAIEQADLNWENPKVREEVKRIIDFRVDLGVDGFRCDVLDMISKDFQTGKNGNGPRLHEFINEIFGREKTKHLYTVGECWGTSLEERKRLTGEDRGELVTAFIGGDITHEHARFDLPEKINYDLIHTHIAQSQKTYNENNLIFAPFFENHDLTRCISKFANDEDLRYESATFFATILYTLKGTPFILQGQEFGTPDSWYDSITDFDDVETINFYKANMNKLDYDKLLYLINHDTRDNGRHPIAWDNSINAGFNNGFKPRLPINSRATEINLENDLKSTKSVFKYFKRMISLRKSSDVLIYGDFIDLTKDRKDCFIYERVLGDEHILIVANYDKPSTILFNRKVTKLISNYDTENNGIFRPFEVAVYKIEK